jgi:hypothetical protein
VDADADGSAFPPCNHRGVHERHVRERLREVAEHAVVVRVVFFRKKADIVADCAATMKSAA